MESQEGSSLVEDFLLWAGDFLWFENFKKLKTSTWVDCYISMCCVCVCVDLIEGPPPQKKKTGGNDALYAPNSET